MKLENTTMYGIFISLVIISHVAATALNTDFELEFIQALFRHGDRIIDESEIYPKDPYNASMYEPYGYGQLTNAGKRREYGIGQMLRRRYGELIGETYKPGAVYAYSTDQDRTKASLQLVLGALYPPLAELRWNETLDWTPIPFEYRPRKFDFMSTAEQCRDYGELFDEAVASPEVQKKLHEHRDFIEYLSNNTGMGMYPSIAVTLYHTIRSQMGLGLPFPSWCNETVYQKLQELVALRFDVFTHTSSMTKLAVGPTIRRFVNSIADSRNGTRKIHLYSGHDSNVAPFLRAHNFTRPRVVDYGSTIIMEKLRGKDNLAYVRFLFWPGAGEQLSALKLKNCGEICPLDDYLKLIDSVLPAGEGTECLYKDARENVEKLINGPISNEPVNARSLVYV